MSLNISTTELRHFADHMYTKVAKENAPEVIINCGRIETIPPEYIKTEVADELYKEHEIKEEMAIGPVVLQGGSVESSGGDNKMTNDSDCGSFVAVNKTEDVIVKSEQEGAVSFVEIEVPALYEGHEVKEEMVLGPVVLQKDVPVQYYLNIDTCKMSDGNYHDVTTTSAHTHNTVPHLNSQISKQKINKKEHNIMTCKVYTTEFKTKMSLKEHTKDILFCDYCMKGFNLKAALVNHILAHTGEYKFKCSVCNLKFRFRRSLKRHFHTHVGANLHMCEICSKTFSFLCDLKAHQWTHKKIKLKHVFCEICQKQLKRRSMSQHYKTHTGERPFKCDSCDKRFGTKVNLKRHQLLHTGFKPFKCEFCNERFFRKSILQSHHAVHTGVEPFICDICDKRFSNKDNLKRHQGVHLKDPSRHVDVKPLPCDICDKRFSNKDGLRRHRVIHSKNQSIYAGGKPFPCDMCDKKFCRKNELKHHQAIHTGVKLFSCDICDKRFCYKNNLKRHMRIH